MKRTIILLILTPIFLFLCKAQDTNSFVSLNTTQLQKLADSLRNSGAFEDAISANNELFARYFESEMYLEGISSLNENSPCYWRRGLLTQADSINKAVFRLMEEYLPEDAHIYADLMFNLASVDLFYGKFDSARIQYKNSYDLLLKQDSTQFLKEINTLSNLGAAFYYEGDLDSALYYFEKSFVRERELYKEEQRDTVSVEFAQQYSNLAALHVQKGNNKKGLKFSKKSLEIVNQLNSKSELGYSNVSYGYILARNGAYNQGLEYIETGVKINMNQGAYEVPYNLNELTLLAEVYTWTKEFEKADSVLNLFFELSEQFEENTINLANGYMTKGYLEELQSNFEEAIPFYEKAIEQITIQVDNTRTLAICYNNILINNFKLGRDSIALAIFEEASDLSAKNFGESSLFWMGLQQAYAEYLLDHGMLDQAKKGFSSIMKANKIDGIQDKLVYDPWFDISALRGLAKVSAQYASTDSLRKTIDYYHQIDNKVNELRLSFLNFYDRIRISDSLNSIYDEAVSFAIELERTDNSRIADVFHFMESSKSYNLYQALRVNDVAKRGNAEELYERKSEIESDISYYVDALGKSQKNEDEAKTILFQTKLSNLISERDELNANISSITSAVELMRSNKTISLDKVTHTLNENTAIIEYTITKDSVHAFLITKKKVELMGLGKTSVLNDLVHSFLNASSNRTSSLEDFKKSAYPLYQFLIARLSLDSFTEILIVPDEQLYMVPFEALIQDETGNFFGDLSYMIKDYTIKYSQSLTLSDFLTKKKSLYRNRLLAIAPEFRSETVESMELSNLERSNFTPLPGAKKEVGEIEKYFEVTKLVGKDASETSIKQMAPDYDILHFATHALVNNKYPLRSKILLNKSSENPQIDGILYSDEILDLLISPEMVVLSACNSGVGEIYKGEGVVSLSSSFFYSGAKSVIMTQWQTNDLSSSKIMAGFYKYLSNGEDKATALRHAKLDYLNSVRNAQTHPYFWSQFVLYGKNDPLVRSFDFRLLAFILIVVALISFYMMRRKKAT